MYDKSGTADFLNGNYFNFRLKSDSISFIIRMIIYILRKRSANDFFN